MRNRIKVLIAEEHFLIRQALRQTINEVKALKLCGEAENDEQLQHLIPILQPQVIITGIFKPLVQGQEAAMQLATNYPHINIIVFSNCAEAAAIIEITGAGASGYIMKTCQGHEIITAIHAACNNHIYYCSNTLKVLKDAAAMPRKYHANGYPQKALTIRESEVMLLMCREKSCKEIGVLLKLSKRTIEGHRQQVLRKTQSKNVLGVLKYAMHHNLFVLAVDC